MKKIHLLFIIILVTLHTQAQNPTNKTEKSKPATKRDSTYFVGEWNMYNYTISKTGDTAYYHYTTESNGYYDKKGFIANADPIGIANSNERDSTLQIYWLYEKGMMDLKFVSPDSLYFDERIYVDAPHIWKAYKVEFISADEFIIKNWRWEHCYNRFVKRARKN